MHEQVLEHVLRYVVYKNIKIRTITYILYKALS